MTDPIARDQLKAFVARIERLEEERKTISDDIADVYTEADGQGYPKKVLRKLIALRKKREEDRIAEDMMLDTFMSALGMLPATEEAA